MMQFTAHLGESPRTVRSASSARPVDPTCSKPPLRKSQSFPHGFPPATPESGVGSRAAAPCQRASARGTGARCPWPVRPGWPHELPTGRFRPGTTFHAAHSAMWASINSIEYRQHSAHQPKHQHIAPRILSGDASRHHLSDRSLPLASKAWTIDRE